MARSKKHTSRAKLTGVETIDAESQAHDCKAQSAPAVDYRGSSWIGQKAAAIFSYLVSCFSHWLTRENVGCGWSSAERSKAASIVDKMAGHLSIRSRAGLNIAHLVEIEAAVKRLVEDRAILSQQVQMEKRKNEELKQAIQDLKPKAPPPQSLLEYGRVMFASLVGIGAVARPSSPVASQTLYTVAVVYMQDLQRSHLKPVVGDVVAAISKELEPLRLQGLVGYQFVQKATTDELKPQDVHVVILLGLKTTERLRMAERKVYGELDKGFGGDDLSDRRYVLMATSNIPSAQNVVCLDKDEERVNIPSHQMVRRNMSTVFISGLESKHLISCDMNTSAIHEVCKWIVDATSKI
ncbi:hypothetical protein SeMB42_g05145 [Synchytrium endobioticum]|uniref:Uncharacterized protein n=1 Tax=Synchytrium endobioticum TaxID=286115 RepID=A0A507D038_9FUNG|nr:hypothetical protein SeMB42_g05145 [Synchytrium endobioticum]TPX44520.1 hypothetical protein SeLEV6574_g04449 [Synchytrium endobioticum]